MLYELREYYTTPGNQAKEVDRLKLARRLFEKHGLRSDGFWTDDIGRGSKITYFWIYETFEERNKALASFRSDPEWQPRSAQHGVELQEVIQRVDNVVLEPTYYSPTPDFSTNAIHELRLYYATPGKLPALNKRFADHSDRLLRKHGMNVVGYWTELVGDSTRLVWIVGYDSLAHREQCWNSFRTDDEWPGVLAESIKDGEIVGSWETRIMKPTGIGR